MVLVGTQKTTETLFFSWRNQQPRLFPPSSTLPVFCCLLNLCLSLCSRIVATNNTINNINKYVKTFFFLQNLAFFFSGYSHFSFNFPATIISISFVYEEILHFSLFMCNSVSKQSTLFFVSLHLLYQCSMLTCYIFFILNQCYYYIALFSEKKWEKK